MRPTDQTIQAPLTHVVAALRHEHEDVGIEDAPFIEGTHPILRIRIGVRIILTGELQYRVLYDEEFRALIPRDTELNRLGAQVQVHAEKVRETLYALTALAPDPDEDETARIGTITGIVENI